MDRSFFSLFLSFLARLDISHSFLSLSLLAVRVAFFNLPLSRVIIEVIRFTMPSHRGGTGGKRRVNTLLHSLVEGFKWHKGHSNGNADKVLRVSNQGRTRLR